MSRQVSRYLYILLLVVLLLNLAQATPNNRPDLAKRQKATPTTITRTIARTTITKVNTETVTRTRTIARTTTTSIKTTTKTIGRTTVIKTETETDTVTTTKFKTTRTETQTATFTSIRTLRTATITSTISVTATATSTIGVTSTIQGPTVFITQTQAAITEYSTPVSTSTITFPPSTSVITFTEDGSTLVLTSYDTQTLVVTESQSISYVTVAITLSYTIHEDGSIQTVTSTLTQTAPSITTSIFTSPLPPSTTTVTIVTTPFSEQSVYTTTITSLMTVVSTQVPQIITSINYNSVITTTVSAIVTVTSYGGQITTTIITTAETITTITASVNIGTVIAPGDTTTITAPGGVTTVTAPGYITTITAAGATITVTAPGDITTVTAPGNTSTVSTSGDASTVTSVAATTTITAPGGVTTVTAPGDITTIIASGDTSTVTAVAATTTITAPGGVTTVTAPGVISTISAQGDTTTVTVSGNVSTVIFTVGGSCSLSSTSTTDSVPITITTNSTSATATINPFSDPFTPAFDPPYTFSGYFADFRGSAPFSFSDDSMPPRRSLHKRWITSARKLDSDINSTDITDALQTCITLCNEVSRCGFFEMWFSDGGPLECDLLGNVPNPDTLDRPIYVGVDLLKYMRGYRKKEITSTMPSFNMTTRTSTISSNMTTSTHLPNFNMTTTTSSTPEPNPTPICGCTGYTGFGPKGIDMHSTTGVDDCHRQCISLDSCRSFAIYEEGDLMCYTFRDIARNIGDWSGSGFVFYDMECSQFQSATATSLGPQPTATGCGATSVYPPRAQYSIRVDSIDSCARSCNYRNTAGDERACNAIGWLSVTDSINCWLYPTVVESWSTGSGDDRMFYDLPCFGDEFHTSTTSTAPTSARLDFACQVHEVTSPTGSVVDEVNPSLDDCFNACTSYNADDDHIEKCEAIGFNTRLPRNTPDKCTLYFGKINTWASGNGTGTSYYDLECDAFRHQSGQMTATEPDTFTSTHSPFSPITETPTSTIASTTTTLDGSSSSSTATYPPQCQDPSRWNNMSQNQINNVGNRLANYPASTVQDCCAWCYSTNDCNEFLWRQYSGQWVCTLQFSTENKSRNNQKTPQCPAGIANFDNVQYTNTDQYYDVIGPCGGVS